MRQGKFAVLIGPAAVGKSTVLAEALRRLPDAVHLLSTTTRAPRPGEVDGRDFRFLTRPEFESRIAADDFLEWARYPDPATGEYYGTSRSELERLQASHALVLKIVEVQGAIILQEKLPECLTVFFVPSVFEALEGRLLKRPNAKPEDIAGRLEAAKREIAIAHRFDRVVVNPEGRIEDCILETLDILIRHTRLR